MNKWNIVFLVLIVILGIGAVYLTAQSYTIHQRGQQALSSLEKNIETENDRIQKAIDGTAPTKAETDKAVDELALGELENRLRDLVFERSRAWFACKPGNLNVEGKVLAPRQPDNLDVPPPADRLRPVQLVEVRVIVTGPEIDRPDGEREVPRPDDLRGIVYVFQENEEGNEGVFLGRFAVTSAQPVKVPTGWQVALQAANELNEVEIQRLQRSLRGTWAVYSTMPIDRYAGVFDRVAPEEIEAVIPGEAKRDELTNPDRVLRDFEELLRRGYESRVLLNNKIDAAKRANQSLVESLEIAAKEDQDLRNDIEKEKKRIEAMKQQSKVFEETLTEYDTIIEDLRKDISNLQKLNRWYFAKTSEYQAKVAGLIEERADAAAAEDVDE